VYPTPNQGKEIFKSQELLKLKHPTVEPTQAKKCLKKREKELGKSGLACLPKTSPPDLKIWGVLPAQ